MAETKVKLSAITVDDDLQIRVNGVDQSIVDDYAEAIQQGDNFPPVTVFKDGKTILLADGFHRFYAHKKLNKTHIDCIVVEGTKTDALVFSVSANATHGLRRTNQDKRNSVLTLLKIDEWFHQSDRAIARKAGVSYTMVSSIRKDFLGKNADKKSSSGKTSVKKKIKKNVAKKQQTKNVSSYKQNLSKKDLERIELLEQQIKHLRQEIKKIREGNK